MLKIRKAEDRGYGEFGGWLKSYHSFSFAEYYDPEHIHFSHLRVINEDRVKAGYGFGTHPHNDMEILSYVLDGTIAHKDSMGNVRELKKGEFQIMSAGTGVTHSEFNPSDKENLHFYQIWILPEAKGLKPRYDEKKFEDKEGEMIILSQNPEKEEQDVKPLKVFQDMKLIRHQYFKKTNIKLNLNKDRKYYIQIVKGNVEIENHKLTTSDAFILEKESEIELKLSLKEDEDKIEFLIFDLSSQL